MKKIAFLFLTRGNHNCEEIWNVFFENVPIKYYNIYNHYKVKPNQSLLKNNSIKKIIPTQWAHISLVKATILLLLEAYMDKNNYYFILLSDSCIPLISFVELMKYLHYINKPIIHYKHLGNKLSRYLKLHPILKNKLPFNKFYSQHQWMVLTRIFVYLILIKNFIIYFNNVDVPDEHYFITLFYIHGKHKEIYNKKITYCNWDNNIMHPKIYDKLNINEIYKLRKEGYLFFRKISKNYKITNEFYNLVRSDFKMNNLK